MRTQWLNNLFKGSELGGGGDCVAKKLSISDKKN